MGSKIAVEKDISAKNNEIIQDEHAGLMKVSKMGLKEIAKTQGLTPSNKKSKIAKQILGASYQKSVKLEKVFVQQPETLTKDQAKAFAKEEKATDKEYAALGLPKIAKQEGQHAKFFHKRSK
jgi:hypothetical protein